MGIDNELTRRSLLRLGMIGAGVVGLGPLAAACSSSSSGDSTVATTTTVAPGDPLADLLAAAREEGALDLIAVPEDPGSYYEHVLAGFTEATGVDITLSEPGASSEMELNAVRNGLDTSGEPPDVIDVGVTHAVRAARDGLLASVTPPDWADVPSAAKDPDGAWIATYYGLIGIVSNPSMIDGMQPASLEDLLALPEGAMGFAGDPRSPEAAGDRAGLSSAEGFAAVWTLALANGGSLDDIGPGIDFCADLVEAGVLDPAALGIPELVGSGTVAVSMLNNFVFPQIDQANRSEHGGDGLAMHFVGGDDLFPNYAAQAVVETAPHPDAARAWLAYLVSPEGARRFLEGGAIPVRFATLHDAGEVGDDDLGRLGEFGITAEQLVAMDFPLPAQIEAAQAVVDERWGPDVMGE